MERHITLPLTREEARTIKSGEQLLLSGVIYTARDAAHKRLCELVEKGEPLPFDVKNATIYYVGPTPAKPGQVIGSAGPTTSYRMDAYSPTLIREGETGMIGKGKRNAEVIDAMKKYGAVYFAAIGGAGALYTGPRAKAPSRAGRSEKSILTKDGMSIGMGNSMNIRIKATALSMAATVRL